jgi:predicted Rossmann fold nucleotide-binding protein DprA/Smf involved in DNA uptake
MINLAIIGSRNFTDKTFFNNKISEWITKYGKPNRIISGGAKGADTLAADYARERGIELIIYFPDWTQYGKAAGPIRNTLIINHCTHVLAFPSKNGIGTQDSLQKAEKLGKDITVYFFDEIDVLTQNIE